MAGNLQFVGHESLVFGPIEVLYGPKGTTTRYTVTSINIQDLVNYYNYIITFGASGTLKGLDKGIDGETGAEDRILQVELPGLVNDIGNYINELFFDQWELLTNESTDTIFNDPVLIGSNTSTINGRNTPVLNYNANVILSNLATNGGTPDQSVTQVNSNLTTSSPPGTLTPPTVAQGGTAGGQFTLSTFTAAQNQLLIEIQKGQTEYENPTQVLRHTSYKNATSTYNSNRQFEECIYTTAQLLTEVGSGWTYNLPADLYTQIAHLPIKYAAPNEAAFYTWGWLKRVSRQPVLANFMVEVSTEYELNLWSSLRYQLR